MRKLTVTIVAGVMLAQFGGFGFQPRQRGYIITRPGAPFPNTTYVQPDHRGGYIATTPGAGFPNTTFINPDHHGGYIATTPGAPFPNTTFIHPGW